MNLQEQLDTMTCFGRLGLVGMRGCETLTQSINSYIRYWHETDCNFTVSTSCPRFGTGEGKGVVNETVRGYDVYILCDVFNYGVTYELYGKPYPMSPDDHFQDLKRTIAAMSGKARRITVIMPMLYEGRQHRRNVRESLDCALALQELVGMGVSNIITFDAHDPRVQNAIPLNGFDTIQPTYQMIKALVNTVPDISLTKEKALVVSPDEGSINRCMYYSSVLGLDLGMFYKRRDYSVVVDGRNPIIAHEFLGNDVGGKDVIVVDDIISTGESVLDITEQLKSRNAGRIFVFGTFGLFSKGYKEIQKAYEKGHIAKIFTTNLVYQPHELLQMEWYESVDMSKYIAILIDALNYDQSISGLLNPAKKIDDLLRQNQKIFGKK